MIPFFSKKNGSDFIYDLKMSNDFFKSLENRDYKLILIYNQGCFTNEELDYYLSKSCVYHKTIGQRSKLQGLNEDFEKNLIGLKTQYGAYGQKELS